MNKEYPVTAEADMIFRRFILFAHPISLSDRPEQLYFTNEKGVNEGVRSSQMVNPRPSTCCVKSGFE